MGTAEITVVIAAYNAAPFLDVTFQSISWQTLLPREVILIDDASEDETSRVVERWIGKLPITCITNQTNLGVGASRNIGLRAASTDVIAIMDADDMWLPEHLEVMFECLAEKDVIVSPRAVVWQSGTGLELTRQYASDVPPRRQQFESLCSNNFVFAGVMARRSVFHELGLYPDERVAEDYLLWLKATSRGKYIVKPDRVTVLYRRHAHSLARIDSSLYASVRNTLDRHRADFGPREQKGLANAARNLAMREHLARFDEDRENGQTHIRQHLLPVLARGSLRLKVSALVRLFGYSRKFRYQ